jgi:hemerythrin superfamily protein
VLLGRISSSCHGQLKIGPVFHSSRPTVSRPDANPTASSPALRYGHNRVRGIFARFKKAKESDDIQLLGELAGEIIKELQVHTSIEESQSYPWVKDISDDTEDTVTEGIEEHHVVKTLIEEIQALEAGQDQWTAMMTVLIEYVEHHAEEAPRRAGARGQDRSDSG